MIFLKTDEEVELMRISNQVVAKTLAEIAKAIKEGVTTQQLNNIADEYIRDNGGIPSFLNYNSFPSSLCVSPNDVVVHGVPADNIVIKEGDIVSVDCGVLLNGFHGDSAYTFCVGEISPEIIQLMKTTKEALYKGIEMAVEGKRLGDIGNAIQNYCEKEGYSVVREMVGHGVGRSLHEDPEVPNYGKRGDGKMLKSGMTLAIEPMINLGKKEIVVEQDGWTARTKDHKHSAHYEHSVVVRRGKAEILSTFEPIEKVLKEKGDFYII
jgi:methionyl aminopeptidase